MKIGTRSLETKFAIIIKMTRQLSRQGKTSIKNKIMKVRKSIKKEIIKIVNIEISIKMKLVGWLKFG